MRMPTRNANVTMWHGPRSPTSHQQQAVISRKVKEATATLSPNMLRQLQKALLDFGCLDARCAHAGVLRVGHWGRVVVPGIPLSEDGDHVRPGKESM